MVNEIFKYQKANFQKLINYGFKKLEDNFKYETTILNNQFKLTVCVTSSSQLSTVLVDSETGEEYILHLLENCQGEFVGRVRNELEAVLLDIKNNCFEKEIFKSPQTKQIINYIKTKYNDDLEFLWEEFPTNAIWRRKDNKKWYALLIVLQKNKLGYNSNEVVEILDIRAEPETQNKLIDNKTIFAGYHMNKKYWLTICLDNTISNNKIFDLIDSSYNLAKK